MGSRRTLAVLAVVLFGVIALQFLPSAPAEPDEPYFPSADRIVGDDPAETDWSPAAAVRDPFVPLVLPDPPTTSASDGETDEAVEAPS